MNRPLKDLTEDEWNALGAIELYNALEEAEFIDGKPPTSSPSTVNITPSKKLATAIYRGENVSRLSGRTLNLLSRSTNAPFRILS